MTDVKGLTGAETLLRVLAAMGVEHIFASPGSEWSPVWESLARARALGEPAPAYLSSRHEGIAVGMASGYTKASGRLAGVILHTTVGALHGAIGLRAAVHEQVPMVVFVGESMSYGEGESPDPGAQWLRYLSDVGGPARVLQPCVKWSLTAMSSSTFPATVQRACQIALTSPRGPVLVSVPMEILFETMTMDAPEVAALPRLPAADTAGIEELARMLAEAENPVIVAEEAGRSAAAVEQLVALAGLLGAPVVETWGSTTASFPRTHPLHGGIEPRAYFNETDLFFLVGAVEPWHPPSAGPRPGARVAVLDEDPLRGRLPYWGYRVDLCLTGQIERSLAMVLEQLRKRIAPDDPARRGRAERWSARHAQRTRAWREEAVTLRGTKPIDARWLVHELNQVLPPDAVVVDETVTHRPTIHRLLDNVRPGAFFAGCYGGLGTGLGTALGVKLAYPGRPVLALIGDGSFNYNPVAAGFGFAQEHRMPVMVVLFNNHGYLSQKAPVTQYYPEGWAARTKTFVGTSIAPAPNYAGLARLFDGYGERVEEPRRVRPAIRRGLDSVARGRLALIDVWLEPVNPQPVPGQAARRTRARRPRPATVRRPRGTQADARRRR